MQQPFSSVPELLDHVDLWTAYWNKRDSVEAQTHLLELYMPFARKVLARLLIRLPSHVKGEDLLNSAIIGLYEAICRFDPNTGIHFEAFALRRIRGAILDELRACDPLSRTQRNMLEAVEKTINHWAAEHSAFPDDDELANAMQMKTDDLLELMDLAQPWLSLDAPITLGDRQVLLGDILAEADKETPAQETQLRELQGLLRRCFRLLPAREQKILYLYYYEELRLREIALLFELTEARVCQIHAMAIARLKAALTKIENPIF